MELESLRDALEYAKRVAGRARIAAWINGGSARQAHEAELVRGALQSMVRDAMQANYLDRNE